MTDSLKNLIPLVLLLRSGENPWREHPVGFHDQLVFFLDIIYSKKENNMKFNI